MRLAHCRTLFLLSHLVMTRGSFSITVIHLPKWIGYVNEIDDEEFSHQLSALGQPASCS